MDAELPPLPLGSTLRSSYVDCTAAVGLRFHVLTVDPASEANEAARAPLVVFLHGFPELAYSWRKVLPLLAKQFPTHRLLAPDQRGFGRTTGWEDAARSFEAADLARFATPQLVADVVALVQTLGYNEVACVVGHDSGALPAAAGALMRPDMFKSVVTMSHPFTGVPGARELAKSRDGGDAADVHAALARRSPPLKHYKWYNSTEPAAKDWETPEQGMEDFFRGYYHTKSAAYPSNRDIRPLEAWTASELARLPAYYIMPLDATMPQAIAQAMEGRDGQPDPGETSASKAWLSEADLAVYATEWRRTGFQGALNWYRTGTFPSNHTSKGSVPMSEAAFALRPFAGKKTSVPAAFISGEQDWGNYQEPGVLETLGSVYEDFRGVKLIPGAGHWVQQEQPTAVVEALADFLNSLS